MTYRPFAWLPACFLGLTLAACSGGSGGGGDDNPIANNSAGGAGGAAKSGTFIAAAGPLCAKRSANNNCIQPTSSSATDAVLIESILNPKGDLIDFDSIGHVYNFSYVLSPPSVIKSMLLTSYGTARRHVQAGRNTFTVDGRYYANAEDIKESAGSDRRSIRYRNGRDTNSVTFSIKSQENYDSDAELHGLSEGQVISNRESESAKHLERAGWHALLTPLTDQTDAPQARKVTYLGSVVLHAGSGGKLDVHTDDNLDQGVGYEAELDTVTGKLTGVSVDYTDHKTRRRIRLELPELRFENSRLDSASRRQRIHSRIEGPGDDTRGYGLRPDTATTQQEFTVEGLEGEIIGKSAYIRILGSGPKGTLDATLFPKDLAPDDLVIHIPMKKP